MDTQIRYLAYLMLALGTVGEPGMNDSEIEDALDADRIFLQIAAKDLEPLEAMKANLVQDLSPEMLVLYCRYRAYQNDFSEMMRAQNGESTISVKKAEQNVEYAREHLATAAERVLLTK